MQLYIVKKGRISKGKKEGKRFYVENDYIELDDKSALHLLTDRQIERVPEPKQETGRFEMLQAVDGISPDGEEGESEQEDMEEEVGDDNAPPANPTPAIRPLLKKTAKRKAKNSRTNSARK